jgi:hypothetical protein
MSSLSIPASVAAAGLQQQLPANSAANNLDTRRQPTNANAPATAPSANPSRPVAPPDADHADQAVQQAAAANASATNSKAIQAGSNRVPSLLDIHV